MTQSTQLESASVPATVERVAETVLPTRHGTFRMIGYRDGEGTEHVALAQGIDDGVHAAQAAAPLVRVHSECLTGDAFGSWRCDCGEQLDAALAAISEEGRGVVVYVRGHEGRGIGLLDKLKAYALQDRGVDTVDANTALGLPIDARRYDQAAEILQDLGIGAVRLLSGNPAKEEALEDLGIAVVERRGLPVSERSENAGYLATKRARMRHDEAPSADAWSDLLDGVVPAAPAQGEAEELAHRYGYLAGASGQIVVGQLRQSLDGFIASRSGDSGFHEDRGDHGHLQRLRALVDAVVVGASTVLTEDCSLAVEDVPGSSPVRVVLDAAARVGVDARVLADDGVPTLWIVGHDAAVPAALPASVEVVRLAADDFAPRRVLDILQARDLWKVLVEGGGNTVSRFLEAGLLDRLYLTTAPVLVGDGVPGIRFSGSDALAEARTAPVRRFVFGQDICTEFNFAAVR
ncbi:GTP cyclohydrolase II [Arthrobacter sedimenti]|uniref:GTP cyclohydrolase II n=1 Tax=Arthrobacter sedimenti TaxID=2694931 RepID=UPI000B35F12B|nr:GTP cyclohydrolase II [Arthrobacter sedimenti]OUM39639.1 GTP cyclohydrolase II [Arthrobacter agilis]